ncbi:hypothetical protein MUK42_13977 [Musa troglodytarum]|uniref:Macro domain-containing protein n=1 Tax=Musa troglodytarum TaxID=320322 RepID=A0A9E7IHQ4_9LILI|nr:hypothetical protein MUK42_13977 [Musa troglodytarum]
MESDPNPHDPSPTGGGEEAKKGLVVLLVGAPGSGKSTFCNDVMAAARRPWVRVCQDTIANGKQGTKLQCLMSAATALKDGKSVFIDRCNLEQEQRADFVKLGEAQADVHAVVLDLPARLCISRSVKRTGHEGKLQGGNAAVVVNRMLQKKELPKLSEGFSRITFCHGENDVKDAVKTYSNLGPLGDLSAGVFGQKNKDDKVQLGIMRFLKKVDKQDQDASGNDVTSDRNFTQAIVPRQDSIGNTVTAELKNKNEDHGSLNDENSSERSFVGGSSCNGIHTLAFPSISTSDFQFDLEKASDIIVDSVSDFLKKFDSVRLVLVDLSDKSKILSLVRKKAAEKNIESNKFFTFVGDITQLYTKGNFRCNVIANATNWRLKPGGGGVNAAIYRAAGDSLEIATKERAETLSPGNSVVVPLPSSSPLHLREGVTHVIHVLGPNMNPQRPNYLKNDYVEGCKILHDAYSSLFENFASIKCQMRNESKRSSSGISNLQNPLKGTTGTCFSHSDQKIKQEGWYYSERNKKCKGFPFNAAAKEKMSTPHGSHGYAHSETHSDVSNWDENSSNLSSSSNPGREVKEKKCAEVSKRTWNAWAQALHEIALNPEKHKDVVMELSDDFVVLNDLYPKAIKHVLVLSRLHGLDCLVDVRKEHLPLLKQMHSVGLKWAETFLRKDSSLIFRLGYHSVPSMRQLHLHVISQDFDSVHLKNKKHWNSFNTSFFRDSAEAIKEIERHGVATVIEDESLLKMELRCHRCRSAHPNIPRLKSHIANCKAPLPAHLLHNGLLVSAASKSVG